jgi:uncharacterized protein
MKHSSILTAVAAALSRPAIVRTVATDRWRNGAERARKGAWILKHPRTALEIAQLFSSRQLRPLRRAEPRLMLKFVSEYLASDLTREERAELLIHHYTYVKDQLNDDFLQWLVDDRRPLHELLAGNKAHRIWLTLPHAPDNGEGDLTLIFEVGGVDLYTLSFTIGPGSIAGLHVPHVMYIGRVQGKGMGLDRIREATKDCYDIQPSAMLLAAADGIAHALGIEDIVGIGASTHISTRYGIRPETFVKAYDEFWKAVGGAPIERHMYHLSVPLTGKPIRAVKRDHRSRALRKRRIKKALADDVCKAFRDGAMGRRRTPAARAIAD